eukprot:gnl/TRDRNA2_/TRDRNA2_147444_c0_seq1.p1 gnl/TRDRNA2_/TRDRNA2_147444_c0~~gnl/TRDRNA2_/TRDRNA2_147444_c0_seq1.p1  ORF type:complete len:380 (-),score=61.01 gnl/TRDRNA2_/TRDRNA2_147444_c0_seq1:162-1226(-)
MAKETSSPPSTVIEMESQTVGKPDGSKSAATKPPAKPAIAPVPGKSQLGMVAYLALGFLTVQNSAAVLMMRYSRAIPSQRQYLVSTLVIMQEVVKVVFCAVLVFVQQGTLEGCYRDKAELLKMAVPAGLYLLQNNLQFVGVENLQAATYQVTYQLKILSTAILWVILLGRRLSVNKWMALLLLTIGVALVQLSEIKNRPSSSGSGGSHANIFKGVVATLVSTLCSGAAGVYFEKLLKDGSKLSVWERNLQLACYSVIIGVGGFFCTGEWHVGLERGFFGGYTYLTISLMFMNGCGGLLVAVVIKYADNILKNVAQTLSIVISCYFSHLYLEMELSQMFLAGAGFVSLAIFLYSR